MTLITHPDNLEELKKMGRVEGGSLNGTPIISNPFMQKYKLKTHLPKERFIEYEAGDVEWLEFFGMLEVVNEGMLFVSVHDDFLVRKRMAEMDRRVYEACLLGKW